MKNPTKFLVFLFIGMLSIHQMNAQAVYPLYPNYINCGSDSDELKNMSQKEIYVVKIGDKEYDDALVSAVEKYWKQSKSFKVIDASEVQGLAKEKGNYFISPISYMNGAMFITDFKKYRYEKLAIFVSDGKKLFHDQVIANLPSFGFPVTIEYLVRALNDGIDFVIKNNLDSRKKALFGLLTESKKNCAILKKKTLLINTYNIEKIEDIKKYNYKCEVKSFEEINKLIKEGNKNYCVLSTCIDYQIAVKSIYIYDIETKLMVYGNFTMAAKNLYAADYIRLNDAIEGKLKK